MQNILDVPSPEYYLGWILQLTSKGYHVYQRTDTSEVPGVIIPTRTGALNYIDAHTELED